jgi:hypothetical protein
MTPAAKNAAFTRDLEQTRRHLHRAIASEATNHPRVAAAIRELEGAIAYMERAPHDFGGHKAAAIRDSEAALVELRAALGLRVCQDRKSA